MKCDQHPSHQDLKSLYSAAIEFKNAAPWDWMHDSDLFGVQDPVSGETGYCCIMGAAGEHYALGVYLGGEGLAGILRILSGEFYPHHEEALFVQKCLMASFEDRTYLKKANLQQRGIWEVDFFYVPAPVWEKGKRPYYPYMSLVVEHQSGMILNFQLDKRGFHLDIHGEVHRFS